MPDLTIVLGTRPEIIKLAPIIRQAEKLNITYNLIHTNQHYSVDLDSIFFKELNLKSPDYNLNIGAGTQTEQTARMMIGIEDILNKNPTSYLIVQGDTNSVLAGALTASKLLVPIAHIEAGLRSDDRTMPEEVNRVITDNISSLLFPPTQECADNLTKQSISNEKIHIVGNTIVDSVLQNKKIAEKININKFDINDGEYYLLTLHRPSNVDGKQDLEEIFNMLEAVYKQTKIPFFFPIHPRTKNNIEKFSISIPHGIILHAPVGYSDFLALQIKALAIFTDSGGIQEEACILGIPCLTLRNTTERPETVQVGANILIKRDQDQAIQALNYFKTSKTWSSPFGKDGVSERIFQILVQNL